MLKETLENLIKESLQRAIDSGNLGTLTTVPETIGIEFTKNPEHGDRAISVAMKLTKEANLPPRKIAEAIKEQLTKNSEGFQKIEIAGPGFINLTLDWDLLNQSISYIIQKGADYGQLSSEQRPNKNFRKILLEYVSANPTGDLHLGHGRQAVLGSSIANLLRWAGYQVETEFYINDAGVQIEKLANSARQALLIETGKIQKEDYDIENNYPLESMQEFISLKIFLEHCQNKDSNIEELSLEFFGEIAKKIFLETQKELLSNIHVVFDRWYSEKSNLHQKDLVSKTCQLLDQNGTTYLQDGALWFKAKEYGDERDRVLKKADGNYTYLAADFAYHLDKLSRGHDLLINLWGADHHGQIPGMKGGLKALGMDSERLEIILVQLVSLTKDGQEVKMSKRKGDIVLVRDLVDEVGVDAFRYFLVESQANNRMVFDLELASKQDKDNPVYYIQYAHARCSSILRNICNSRIDQENGKEIPALLTEDELLKWIEIFKSDNKLFSRAFKTCTTDELASSKALILSLVNFPEEIKDSALIYSPYKIANYLKNIAGLFHQFYSHNRVICDDIDLMKARLAIVLACKITIANALKILAISAPEKM
jgi:arginyl-tRNA synthetase